MQTQTTQTTLRDIRRYHGLDAHGAILAEEAGISDTLPLERVQNDEAGTHWVRLARINRTPAWGGIGSRPELRGGWLCLDPDARTVTTVPDAQ